MDEENKVIDDQISSTESGNTEPEPDFMNKPTTEQEEATSHETPAEPEDTKPFIKISIIGTVCSIFLIVVCLLCGYYAGRITASLEYLDRDIDRAHKYIHELEDRLEKYENQGKSDIRDFRPVDDTPSTSSEKTQDGQPILGIYGYNVDANMASTYNAPMGVCIQDIMKGLGADKAGIRPGYIITEVDGKSITDIEQLQATLREFEVGDTVTVLCYVPTEDYAYERRVFYVTLSPKED